MDGGGSNGRFGRWTVRDQLGSGGMGVVYDAVDPTGVRAALKVISPIFASDPSFRSRFRREIEVTRRVSGQRTAAVLDADPDGDPPWLATEFVDGPTLAEAVERDGPLKEPALTAFAVALLQALVEIHTAGVVHRDLKPTNVILTASTPRVIDFGIASAVEATSITATGMSLGSAGWMSPEQVSGDRVATPTDVFAWAAVVAFAATGEPPFGTGRPEALAYRVVHGSPNLGEMPASLRSHLAPAFDPDPGGRPTVESLLAGLAGSDPQATVVSGWSTVSSTRVQPPERPSPTQVVSVPVRDGPTGLARRWAWAAAVVAVVTAAVGVTWFAVDQEAPDTTRTAALDPEEPLSTTASITTAPSTTSPETTTSTTTATAPPPPSPDDPSNYLTTDGSSPSLAPDCLGLVGVCWGDTAERVRELLGQETDRYGYMGDDGQPVVTRRWEIGTASITATFDFVDSVTEIDVGPMGDARNLRLATPGGISTPGSMDLDFESTTMGEVREQLGEPETSTIAGEGMTIYFYEYRIGGEGFLNLLFSHTAFWDDDPGFGPALDARLVDSVQISDTSFVDS